jgi:hypothetical protein
MSERRRMIVMGVGVLVTVVAISGTAILMAVDPGLLHCALTDRFWWVTPFVAASVLGGTMFVLLGQRRPKSDTAASDVTPCSTCERELLGEWRMCPYCGAMITECRVSSRANQRRDT